MLTLPMPERVREAFLTVRSRETLEVITIIEALSPGEKRPGSDGRREYLGKREAVLQSATHLVELDLLRRGERLPTLETRWSLRERLLTIPVPLAGDDPDVALDLQSVVDTVYDRAGYDYSLDYRRSPEPPLSESDAAWVRQRLDQATR